MNRNLSLGTQKWIETLVKSHVNAATLSTWDGRELTPYFHSCRQEHVFRGVVTILTRDVGYHTSGWWKNPDYERCWHLSVSYFDPATREPMPHDRKTSSALVNAFFRRFKKWVWVEPPYSADGRRSDVYHYRLFCDLAWQPLKPRGEVYSRELTAAGWHSYSDVQAAIGATGRNPNRS